MKQINSMMEELNQQTQLGTITNPVKCDGVMGEFEYLEKLVTLEGEPIKYYREGSVNKGGGIILDKNIIQDVLGNVIANIYFDMYHREYREKRIVPGLSHVMKFNERQPYQQIDYLFQQLGKLNLDKTIDLHDQYVYLWSKAGILLSKGAYIYALDDAFGFPIDTMRVKQLKLNCSQIVHELAGVHPTHPLNVCNQQNVLDLLRTFHFAVEQISACDKEDGLYALDGKHLMTNEEITFYFKINP